MVEEGGITWCSSGRAEVVRGGDQSLSEVPVPDPVDHDPGREGVLWGGHPLRQFEPSALGGELARAGGRPDRGEEPPGHGIAKVVGIATQVDADVGNTAILHRHDLGEGLLSLLLQPGPGGHEGLDLLSHRRGPGRFADGKETNLVEVGHQRFGFDAQGALAGLQFEETLVVPALVGWHPSASDPGDGFPDRDRAVDENASGA